MAELLLKVGAGANYEDGDCLCAFNQRRIKACHAEHVCHYQWAGFTSEGLRPDQSLARKMLDRVYTYRFERVGPHQVRRIKSDYMGNVVEETLHGPPEIDVEQYVRRRKKHAKHRIFGRDGAEVWHGGSSDMSVAAIDTVWVDIQTDSDHRTQSGGCPHCGQDHSLWAMGRLDVRHHLAVQVNELTDEETHAMVTPHNAEFRPGQPVRDPDGGIITPSFSNDRQWEHPTGKWVYEQEEDGTVRVEFGKRNIKIDWKAEALPRIGKTEQQVSNKDELVGREHTLNNLDRAPWQRGNPLVQKVLDHPRLRGNGLLYDKKLKQSRGKPI